MASEKLRQVEIITRLNSSPFRLTRSTAGRYEPQAACGVGKLPGLRAPKVFYNPRIKTNKTKSRRSLLRLIQCSHYQTSESGTTASTYDQPCGHLATTNKPCVSR